MKRLLFHKPSLRNKLILTSIACLILPTLIMLYNTDVFSKRIIREHTLENSAQVLNNVQVQIDRILEEMVSVSNMIQFDPEIMNILLQSDDDPLKSQAVTTRIEQLSSGKPNMQINLLTLDGRHYTNYSYYDFNPEDFRDRTWFPKLSGLNAFDTLFIGVQPNYIKPQASTQPYVIMTARALMNYSSKPFAYMIVSRTENTISDIFESFSEQFLLMDDSGHILSHKDKNFIGRDFNGMIGKDVLESPEIIRFEAQNQVFVSVPLRYAGWTLASLAPYEQLTDKLNAIYKSGLILQILSVAGFILVLAYLLRKFTRPIHILGQAALKVEAGELDVRSHVRGGDEVGRLGRAFDQMLDRIMVILEQVKIEQELKRQAEIAMLHAQIHPHFLFNVLSSIRLKLLMKHDEQNAELIGSLASLLRSTFSTKQEFVPLMAEIEMTQQFMDLMNFTAKFPIVAVIDVDSELLMENVPRFILQPIIENAYKHGFVRKSGNVTISARKTEDCLFISVKDNGQGMDVNIKNVLQERMMINKLQIIEESVQKDHSNNIGIGLTNVYDRLKLIYGNKFQMSLQSEQDQGTTVVLVLPIQPMEKNANV
ncbi:sensor histidine kinase [Cohnella endophytica]|uniref:histidine kinase n=1 Tax=Cohnella endophytica TaxID=2419778 RepID=A0A494Y968_9BACL|nr:sensor histidine kinase [Cohnella endophytica]RKP58168.1 sensor histidine kinase [Cohnella endophytica]